MYQIVAQLYIIYYNKIYPWGVIEFCLGGNKMEIKVTQAAAEELKSKITGQGNNFGVRVYLAGMG